MALATPLSIASLLLSVVLHQVKAESLGLLMAVENRVEVISPESNTSLRLPCPGTVLALSPATTGQILLTELGCDGPSVSRLEGESHTVLLSTEGKFGKRPGKIDCHKMIFTDINSGSPSYFEAAAFDGSTNKLYLTNKMKKTVYSLENKPGSKLETFYVNKQKSPSSLTLDACTRSLYWINSNPRSPSIEISSLETGQTWSLLTSDLARPKAITFHTGERALYWAAAEGAELLLSRASSEGMEREEVCRLRGHDAFSIAVDSDYIYWSEWSTLSVWRVPKTPAGGCRPEVVRSFSSKPHGLATVQDQQLNCDGAHTPRAPEPPPQTSSTTTETAVTETSPSWSDPRCVSWCLAGDCVLAGEEPLCLCQEGRRGDRCEEDLCQNYCLHHGQCVVIEDEPVCVCRPPHHGDRCHLGDTEESARDCQNKNDLLLVIMSSVTVVLAMVVMILSVAVHKLRLRPRVVRKRFISVSGREEKVVGTEPRPSCGLPVEDGIQLDIENCCNMTLCETPCFDPPTRGPKKSRKSKRGKGDHDKASLLANCDDE